MTLTTFRLKKSTVAEAANKPEVLLARSSKLWLLTMLVAVCLPQIREIPLWLTVVVGVLLAWGFASTLKVRKPLARWVRWSVVPLMSVGILVSASGLESLAGLATLLIAGAGLKVLELRTRRDGWVLVLVSLFMVAVNFLFDQSIVAALYGFFSLAITFAALISLNEVQAKQVNFGTLKRSATILAQSIPVMVVLFLVFPRIEPLWSVKSERAVAKTGLSNEVDPGSVANLTRNDSIAFRASFTGDAPPERSQRYWRAITYDFYDGRSWLNMGKSVGLEARAIDTDTYYDYEIIMEPTARPWLVALDYPQSVRAARGTLTLKNDFTVTADKPILDRFSYSGRSVVREATQELSLQDRERFLRLPPYGNPQARALAASWVEQQLSLTEKIDALYRRFNQSFEYTLSPGRLGRNSVDQFLFETQRGFCEHFASSTAYLLRLAGHPTRLVGGYQGGEWNPYEKYMLVRQYEAHAWVEVWDENTGWRRLDPTTAVAPERIQLPFDELFGSSDDFIAESPLSVLRLGQNIEWLNEIRLRYEAVNYSWHRWILGYHNQQVDFLHDLMGNLSTLKLLLVIFVPGSLVTGGLIWWLLRTRPRRYHAVDADVQYLSRLVSRADSGLAREQGETVRTYCWRLAKHQPYWEESLMQWLNNLEQLRYSPARGQPEGDASYHACFKNMIKTVKKPTRLLGKPARASA